MGLAVLILGAVLTVLELLELLNGFGSPNDGDEFRDRSAKFSVNISDILNNASPCDWSSDAAVLYEERNEEQQARVMAIAEIDQKIVEILKTQAGQIEQAREGLEGNRLALVAAMAGVTGLVAELLGSVGAPANVVGFLAVKSVLDWTGYFTAMALHAALGLFLFLVIEADRNRKALVREGRNYGAVINDVKAKIPGWRSGGSQNGCAPVSVLAEPSGMPAFVADLRSARAAPAHMSSRSAIPLGDGLQHRCRVNPTAWHAQRRSSPVRQPGSPAAQGHAAQLPGMPLAGQRPVRADESAELALAHRMGFS